MDKEYTGSICLGATRPSYDMETDIEQSFDTSAITEAQIYAAVEKLTGTYEQTSPIFSALKIKGEPMYIKARKGLAVEGKKRTITVHTFEITNITMPYVHFRIVCSKGTYIRSIAYDLGQLLQNGGYLSSLRRTKIDKYDIDNAWQLNDLIAAIRNYNTTTGIDQNARFK